MKKKLLIQQQLIYWVIVVVFSCIGCNLVGVIVGVLLSSYWIYRVANNILKKESQERQAEKNKRALTRQTKRAFEDGRNTNC